MPSLSPPSPAAEPPRETRRYWRSLERLLESPAFDPGVAPPGEELPAGASDPPGEVDRRTMMTLMGASFAMAGLAGCRRPVEHIVPYAEAPEYLVPGLPERYATTLSLGGRAFGAVVESHEGRPTKVEGNELHPSSLGAATGWMQASVLELYDPDRSRLVSRLAAGETTPRDSTWAYFFDAWREREGALQANGGAGLAVLLDAHASPTLARLGAALRARYPAMRWTVFDPTGDANVVAALGGRPVWKLGAARRLVTIDADLLATEGDVLAQARGYAQARLSEEGRGSSSRSTGSRHYAIESTVTLTGANADHRLRLERRRIPAFVAALAAELGVATPGLDAATLPADARAKASLLAADLRSELGGGLVVAGFAQPPAVHQAVLAINRAIGAEGRTFTVVGVADGGWGRVEDFAELARAMAEGVVTDLLILGANPVFTAPADLGFAAALARVPFSAHLGASRDETGAACGWHLPQAHPFESWGDARASDGTASLVQPLIAPLFEGRSAIELVGSLVAGAERTGYELVRETWLAPGAAAPGAAALDERTWRRALHDGLLAPGLFPPPAGAATVEPAPPPAAVEAEGLEVTFHPSRSVADGRFANNAWLQELPDPITKVVWDNAALLAPATAAEHGIASGDWVEITVGERTLEAQAFVLPGQADGSIALELGFGRRAAGRVGNGVGVDVSALRTSTSPWVEGGARLARRRSGKLVQTQEHGSMEGRDLVREVTTGAPPAREKVEGEPTQLFPAHDYSDGPQWGMAIDLASCIGCNACVVACQAENNVPVVGKEQVDRGREMHWLRIDRYFGGAEADPSLVFQPIPCMHCENAPCEQVCPVAATVHDRQGLNAMVYNRCIGTRYCSNNCPYKVRRFNFFNYTKDTPELLKMAMNPDVTVRSRGVMEKCTYCVQRISEGRIAAKKAGRKLRDGEVKTACQQTCPADAIVFGDIRDAASRVAKRKASPRDYVLLGELDNRPRTSYQAKVRNPNPGWGAA